MKEGYIIDNSVFISNEDCVLVRNYPKRNIIHNIPFWGKMIQRDERKNKFTIGVWKVKTKNPIT